MPMFGGMALYMNREVVGHIGEMDIDTLLFSLCWIVFAFAICRYAWKRKHVSVDEHFLYVTNYFKEIVIPLAEVERVTYFGFGYSRTVTLHLRAPSEFGRRIKFRPPIEFAFFGGGEPPVVGELQALIHEHAKFAQPTTPVNSLGRASR